MASVGPFAIHSISKTTRFRFKTSSVRQTTSRPVHIPSKAAEIVNELNSLCFFSSLFQIHLHSLSNFSMALGSNSLFWFRKGLRIHDNPGLECAAKNSDRLYPVFVIDPHYMEPDSTAFSIGSTRAGLNRIQFLLESLKDLDSSLRNLGSRLLVLKGEPFQVLVRCLKEVS